MENYIYKQNTGVLRKNQNLITTSKVIFKVQNIYLIDSSNFRYDCYKCNDCYRLEIYLDNPNILLLMGYLEILLMKVKELRHMVIIFISM